MNYTPIKIKSLKNESKCAIQLKRHYNSFIDVREKIYFPYMCVCIYIYIPPSPIGPVHWMHPTYYTSSAWLTFCTTNSVLWGVLSAAGTCQMPVALPYLAAMTTDVSRHCPVSHGRQNCLWSRTTLIFQLGCFFFFFFDIELHEPFIYFGD